MSYGRSFPKLTTSTKDQHITHILFKLFYWQQIYVYKMSNSDLYLLNWMSNIKNDIFLKLYVFHFQFGLVCDRKGLNKATATIFLVGVMVGAAIFGWLIQKRMLMVAYLKAISFGVASAFSKSFIMFAIMRFFTGMGLTHKVCVEWADIAHRTIAGVIISFDWFFSTMILPVTAPLILAVITWRAPFLPEQIEIFLLVSGSCEVFFKMRKLAMLTGINCFHRFRVAFTYYGNSLNISGFGLNLYLTQFIYGAIELPSKLVAYLCLDKLGRRYSQMGTLITTGVCISINVIIPRDLWLPRTVIFVQGKGFLEASFTCVFLYNTELYPTVLQQNGLGYSSFVGRVGVSLAPLVSLHRSCSALWLPVQPHFYLSKCASANNRQHNIRYIKPEVTFEYAIFKEEVKFSAFS
uniref:Solute carrier family 22 member 7b, tandem duplicate 1 n=1 Tax=Cyprinus carpio TaxID=7962 RepID=A0A8C1V7D0_CYPCA